MLIPIKAHEDYKPSIDNCGKRRRKNAIPFKDIKFNIDQKSFSCQLFTKLKLEMPDVNTWTKRKTLLLINEASLRLIGER
jgi:hypothetical protein